MNHVHVPTLQMVTLLQKERKCKENLQLKNMYKVKQIRQVTAGWSLCVTNVLRWSFQKQITDVISLIWLSLLGSFQWSHNDIAGNVFFLTIHIIHYQRMSAVG